MSKTIQFPAEPASLRRSARPGTAAAAVGRTIARIERTFTGAHAVQNLALLTLLAAPPIALFLIALRPSPRQMRRQRWPTIAFVGLYRAALHRCVEIHGLEHLPRTGPVILAGNHINKTAMDGMLLGSRILTECGGLPKFVSLANPRSRLLKHFVRLMGHEEGVLLPIHEGMTTETMIQFLRNPEAYKRQQPILGIFPVGNADTDFAKHMKREWHTSAAVAAFETGAPIVPFFVEGLPYHWGPSEMLKAVAHSLVGTKAFEFKIRLGPPIHAEGSYKDTMERVRQSVLQLGDES